jgi:tight adherence protein B
MQLIASLIAALTFYVIVILIYSVKQYRKQKIIRRIERQLVATEPKKFSILELIGLKKILNKTQKIVTGIGLKTEAEDAFLIFITFDITLFLVLSILNTGYLSYLIPALMFFIVPYIADSVIQRRYVKFNNQFADALQDISDYLKMTGNLVNSIEKVLPDLENPLKAHFNAIIRKVDSGIDINTALREFSNEAESPLVEAWVDSMIFAGQMKANVADVCEETAKKVKGRLKQNAKIRSLMKGTKTTMIMILLVMCLILVSTLNSGSMYAQAYSTFAGKMVMLYVILSYVITTLLVFKSINKQSTSI